jgi:2-methylisocitrate lyase-like PEP mutase family enzyme
MTAASLRALHRPGDPVVLPNAWDAASARAIVKAGFPAVATSSAAISAVLGYGDGEATPVVEMLDAVARIAAAVEVPVTADIERGYALAPAQIVERLVATGAVGCNLEDSVPGQRRMVDVAEQVEFLSAVRAATVHSGFDVVLNARIDVFVRGDDPPAVRLDAALQRAQRYLEAGADCVYPIGLADAEAIGKLVQVAPVNVLFTPATPSLAELAELGVARISFGSGLHSATTAHLNGLLQRVAERTSPY